MRGIRIPEHCECPPRIIFGPTSTVSGVAQENPVDIITDLECVIALDADYISNARNCAYISFETIYEDPPHTPLINTPILTNKGYVKFTIGEDSASSINWINYPIETFDYPDSSISPKEISLTRLSDNRPAIVYTIIDLSEDDSNTKTYIKYAYANNDLPGETDWNIVDLMWETNYSRPTICVVDGNPAIAYTSYDGSSLYIRRSLDADGVSWGSPVLIDTNLAFENEGEHQGFAHLINHDLKIINNNPCILTSIKSALYSTPLDLHSPYKLVFYRAGNVSGTLWNPPVIIEDNNYVAEESLFYEADSNANGIGGLNGRLSIINGKPAVYYMTGLPIYLNRDEDICFYKISDDIDGTSWPVHIRTWGPFNNIIWGEYQPFAQTLDCVPNPTFGKVGQFTIGASLSSFGINNRYSNMVEIDSVPYISCGSKNNTIGWISLRKADDFSGSSWYFTYSNKENTCDIVKLGTTGCPSFLTTDTSVFKKYQAISQTSMIVIDNKPCIFYNYGIIDIPESFFIDSNTNLNEIRSSFGLGYIENF